MAPMSEMINSEGLALHTLEWGNPEAPAVVMLHGLRAYGYWFEEFAEAASDKFRLIALDQRGRGASAWAPQGHYTTDHYVKDIQALVEQKKLKHFGLIGHSMGGTNSLNYAATQPAELASLVIVDSSPELDPRGLTRIREEMGRTPKSFATRADARAFLREMHSRASGRSIDTRVTWMLREDADGQWQWRIDPSIFDPRMTPDPAKRSWDALAKVTCPTLLVRGGITDLMTTDCAQRVVAALAKGEFAEVPNAGHMVVEDNPSGFNAAVIPFLEKTLL